MKQGKAMSRAGFFERDQIYRILKHIKDQSEEWFTFFFHLLKSGRRLSELTSVRVGDIKFDSNIIVYPILKKRKQVDERDNQNNKIPLLDSTGKQQKNQEGKPMFKKMFVRDNVTEPEHEDPDLMSQLRKYVIEMKQWDLEKDANQLLYFDGFYFKVRRAVNMQMPADRKVITQYLKRFCAQLGMTHVGQRQICTHLLRHTYATLFIQSREPTIWTLEELCNRLHHSSIDVTRCYISAAKKNDNQPNLPLFDFDTPASIPKPVDTQPTESKQDNAAQESATKENAIADDVKNHSATEPNQSIDNKEKAAGQE